jgi:hypothetical protein
MADKRIDVIVKELNSKIEYPPEVIQDVIQFVFLYLKKFLTTPSSAGLRLTYFGVFRVSRNGLYRMLSHLLRYKEYERFKKLWPVRLLVIHDLKRRFKKKYEKD